MVLCPLLYTGNLHIQTSIYSGDSHHHLSAKFSVIQTLSHSASTMCSNPELLQKEKEHLRKALTKCNYPKWLLTRWRKDSTSFPDKSMMGATIMPNLPTMECKVRVILSYPTHKVFVKVSKRSVVDMASKLTSKVAEHQKPSGLPPDKDPMVNQSGAIYWYQCGDLGCDDEYIGETSRTFGERYKEHLKAPSAIHHHSIQTGHTTNQNNFQIVGREGTI